MMWQWACKRVTDSAASSYMILVALLFPIQEVMPAAGPGTLRHRTRLGTKTRHSSSSAFMGSFDDPSNLTPRRYDVAMVTRCLVFYQIEGCCWIILHQAVLYGLNLCCAGLFDSPASIVTCSENVGNCPGFVDRASHAAALVNHHT